MEHYLLDTSALVTLRDDEDGADRVASLLRKAQKGSATLYVSFMSFMEILYCTWREEGKGSALKAYLELKMLPLHRIDLSENLLMLAGEIKATHSLSLADSWIAATALEKKATLVHKDPEFDQLKGKLEMEALPYK